MPLHALAMQLYRFPIDVMMLSEDFIALDSVPTLYQDMVNCFPSHLNLETVVMNPFLQSNIAVEPESIHSLEKVITKFLLSLEIFHASVM